MTLDGLVERDPVRQLDDLDVDPLLLGKPSRKGHKLSDRPGASRDLERLVRHRCRRERKQQPKCV